MVKELKNSFKVRVRYADTDKMGVVYNGNYARFFEIGRTELMRSFGLPYIEVENNGYLLPLIELNVKYIKSAKYDDELEIHSELFMESLVKIKFEYKIYNNNDLIATGFTRHIFVDDKSMKPVKPPLFFNNIIGIN